MKGNRMWTIKKLGYSSNPWRLVDENGREVITFQRFGHPDCGDMTLQTAVMGNTRQEVVDHVISAMLSLRKISGVYVNALRNIRDLSEPESVSFHAACEAIDLGGEMANSNEFHGWIDSNRRLPEAGVNVLCWGGRAFIGRVSKLSDDSDHWGWETPVVQGPVAVYQTITKSVVTHWMPLPPFDAKADE